MRRLISLSTILACGPITPQSGTTSTTDETATTLPTTTALPDPTSPTSSTSTEATTPSPDLPPQLDAARNDCDVWAQDCPPGQKCSAWADGGGGAWNATRCVEITGDGAPGEPCTTIGGGVSGIDDCALGVMCWYLDKTSHGICVALCTGTSGTPQCPLTQSCYQADDAILNLCIPRCDPLAQDCPNEYMCIPAPDSRSFYCVPDTSDDQGQTNDPCEFANACDPGLVCLDPAAASSACDPASPGCCQPLCKFPGSPCPNPDQQCLHWFDRLGVPTPPGYESVGICATPT